MLTKVDELFLNIWAVSVTIGIILTFMVACIFSLIFVFRSKKIRQTWVKIYLSVAYLLVSIIYVYLLFERLTGNPIILDPFALIVVRPSILFLGGALALSSTLRYYSLIYGGEEWTLRH